MPTATDCATTPTTVRGVLASTAAGTTGSDARSFTRFRPGNPPRATRAGGLHPLDPALHVVTRVGLQPGRTGRGDDDALRGAGAGQVNGVVDRDAGRADDGGAPVGVAHLTPGYGDYTVRPVVTLPDGRFGFYTTFPGAASDAGGNVWFEVSFLTVNAWPTSLPGSAA